MDFLTPLPDANNPARTASYTGTAGSTTAWAPGAQGVLVWCTTDAYVIVGDGVTATTSATPIPAYTPIPFTVPPGTSFRVSAIQISAAGTLYAKPINFR